MSDKNETPSGSVGNDPLAVLGDVSKLNALRHLQILHPDTKEPLKTKGGESVMIDVVGNESDDFIAANHRNRRVLQARSMAGEEFDPQVEDDNLYYTLASCTKGWRNIPKVWLSGDPKDTSALPFDHEIAKALYQRLPWLRAQVQTGIWRRESFVKGS